MRTARTARFMRTCLPPCTATIPSGCPLPGLWRALRAITPEILRSCYDAFYHPANMMLCVVGMWTRPRWWRRRADFASGAPPSSVRDYGPPEEPGCCTSSTCRQMDVAMPTFRWASSAPWPGFGPAGARQELVGDLAAEALMGESSRLYLELYQAGLIDSSFAAGYEDMPGWPSSAVAETAGIRGRPGRHLRRGAPVGCRGVEEELFHRLKRSALGRRVGPWIVLTAPASACARPIFPARTSGPSRRNTMPSPRRKWKHFCGRLCERTFAPFPWFCRASREV